MIRYKLSGEKEANSLVWHKAIDSVALGEGLRIHRLQSLMRWKNPFSKEYPVMRLQFWSSWDYHYSQVHSVLEWEYQLGFYGCVK